jgi:phosphate transport system permease protein
MSKAPTTTDTARRVAARRARRHAQERRFRAYGLIALSSALLCLVVLLGTVLVQGASAFVRTEIALEINLDPQILDPEGRRDPDVLLGANTRALLRNALAAEFPEVTDRKERRRLAALLSRGARGELARYVIDHPEAIGTTRRILMPASDDVDLLMKGEIARTPEGAGGRLTALQIGWIDVLAEKGRIVQSFNTRFFTGGDSREPELAGIGSALLGSFYALLVTLALAFPFGLATAVYLEEFAPQNRWTDLIETNVNNLAAVPSIVFGLLGLAVFLNFFALPRSAPLVGGMVLALMTLPTIIIAGRAALKAVPPSIREAALGMGASPLQVVAHHVLPLAMPGLLTGTIIGMGRALGETAPLLMIGMVAFIVDLPSGPLDPASALPVQIFLWADSPERAFVAKTAAATIVLLAFLIAMNAGAVYLRKRFERRW